LFSNGRRRQKVKETIFVLLSSRKQGNKYVQNILLAPQILNFDLNPLNSNSFGFIFN
jgi:hypothetical protein